ncbi:hypothetical protein C1645_823093 [Glomus cerebriforme]|uniref:Uncharacterized protein n=1 Tax=Glomus cerebriforme TaxID=658196 RepID=A0A397SYA8_9GLOM|nr:hypothetical protein C1645_823093 [Glomus cerebriforme]
MVAINKEKNAYSKVHVSDKKLFTIILYSVFVNNEYLITLRDIWKNPWVTGTLAAIALGLVGLLISPIIIKSIAHVLGFNTGGIVTGSFGSRLMSWYGGTITTGSVISILQSIGAVGLGPFAIYLSSGIGAAIGTIIGAIGGSELAKYFNKMELNDSETKILESFVQIDEQNKYNMIVFTLMPDLLNNDIMLKCFIEAFITCSSFSNFKLFHFNFKENNLSKSIEEKVNNTIYDLLIDNYGKNNVDIHFENFCIIRCRIFGYYLNLKKFQSSNFMIKLLVDIWKHINEDN